MNGPWALSNEIRVAWIRAEQASPLRQSALSWRKLAILLATEGNVIECSRSSEGLAKVRRFDLSS